MVFTEPEQALVEILGMNSDTCEHRVHYSNTTELETTTLFLFGSYDDDDGDDNDDKLQHA